MKVVGLLFCPLGTHCVSRATWAICSPDRKPLSGTVLVKTQASSNGMSPYRIGTLERDKTPNIPPITIGKPDTVFSLQVSLPFGVIKWPMKTADRRERLLRSRFQAPSHRYWNSRQQERGAGCSHPHSKQGINPRMCSGPAGHCPSPTPEPHLWNGADRIQCDWVLRDVFERLIGRLVFFFLFSFYSFSRIFIA